MLNNKNMVSCSNTLCKDRETCLRASIYKQSQQTNFASFSRSKWGIYAQGFDCYVEKSE